MGATKAVKKPHWYFLSIWECVLCGRTEEYRERRYTPKPKDGSKRYEYHQEACSCHFM